MLSRFLIPAMLVDDSQPAAVVVIPRQFPPHRYVLLLQQLGEQPFEAPLPQLTGRPPFPPHRMLAIIQQLNEGDLGLVRRGRRRLMKPGATTVVKVGLGATTVQQVGVGSVVVRRT